MELCQETDVCHVGKNSQRIDGTNVENTKENYHRPASHIAGTDVGPMV